LRTEHLPGETPSILLVTGDPGQRDALDALGYEPRVAAGGRSALAIAESDRIDVVLFSPGLPDMSGPDFIATLRKTSPQTEIVVVHHRDEALALKLLPLGVSRFVESPVTPERLREAVESALACSGFLRELDEERRRYRRLVDQAPIGVFEIRAGRFTYANDYLLNLSGYPAEEVLGQPADAFVSPEDRDRLVANLNARMAGRPAPMSPSYAFVTRDGSRIEAELQFLLVTPGADWRLEGVLRDVTVERRLTRLQRTVVSLGETLLVEQNVERILQTVLDAITAHGGFRRAVAALYDLAFSEPLSAPVRQIVASGLSADEVATLRGADGISPEERLLAFVDRFRLGAAYYVPHDQVPWSPSLGLPGTLTVDGWHVDDFLFIPLRGEAGIIGHISVDDPVDQTAPTPESIEPVASLANVAALAIERAHRLRQLQRQKERLRGLSELGRELLKATDVGSLCELAVRRLQIDMAYDYCSIGLREGEEIALQAVAASPLFSSAEIPQPGLRLPFSGEGIVRWALQHGEPVFAPDVLKEPRFVVTNRAIQSEVVMPIPGRRGTLGVINVESRSLNAFGDQDVEILTSLASQLSVAISNLQRRDALSRINALGQGLAQATGMEELVDRALDFLGGQFGFENSSLLSCRAGDELVILGFRSPLPGGRVKAGDRVRFGEGVVGWVAEHQESVLVPDASTDLRYREVVPGIRSEVAVPIRGSGRLLGVLNVESMQCGYFGEEDRELLEAAASELGIAISNFISQEELRQQAIRDPLTGLYNRHYFNEVIGGELERADRYGRPLALLMVDVDGFRAVNNRLGHLRGDEVLCAMAKLLRETVRAADRVIRYGGDEFLILMPETDGDSRKVARRLRAGLERIPTLVRLEALPLGLSIGVYVRAPKDPHSLEEILEEVDRQMYADKRSHRGDNGDDYRH